MRKSFAIVFCFALSLSLFSCGKKESVIKNTAEAEDFISEISPAMIFRSQGILISFTRDITGETLAQKAIKLTGAKGKWELLDERTLRFTPDVPYKSNAEMRVAIDLKKMFGLSENLFYYHQFIAKKADFSLDLDGFEITEEGDEFTLSGTLRTDIPENLENAKKMLSASYSEKLSITWDEIEKTNSRFFTIFGIKRGEKNRTLTLFVDGKAIGADKTVKKKYTIAKKDAFEVIDVNRKTDNTILVSFSSQLRENQDLDGVIIAQAANGFNAKIDANINKNILTFYTDGSWKNVAVLQVQKGLQSTKSEQLASMLDIISDIEWEKPQIKFMNDGVIIPTSRDTYLTVGTKNVSALLIQAYAIYEQNIEQFLQVNELDGEKELYRVGEPVWEKKIALDWNDDYANQFVPRSLDISDLVKKFPEGMFQIRVTFRKDDIKYVCRDNHRDFSHLPFPKDTIGEDEDAREEKSWWDYYNDLDYEDRRTFWNYDDDPCHPAYYMPRYNSNCLIKRNVLVSDLGIMAKSQTVKGEDVLNITVADLKSTKPVFNADLEVLSFVGSKIASGKTDKDGFFQAKTHGKAYLVTAKLNNQASYLKLSAANTLSVDHFEIGGEKAKEGIKGAIYGERGVWRPGDKMYLTFVLQDEKKTLPENIPVIFELVDPLGRSTMQKTLTSGLNGFYAIEAKTERESTTGLWQAKIKVGSNEWTKSLRVESVVPNRLSINLSSDKKILESGKNYFTLKGAWLHGSPSPHYKADVSISFTAAHTAFDAYSEYTFYNPLKSYSTSRETIWEGELDENSTARFSKRLENKNDTPGMMKANMISRIFEPSGAFSAQSTQFDYSPYSRYVGLKLPKGDAARGMLLTDTDHTCDVVLLTAEGEKCEKGELRYRVYKLEWKWWWEKDALENSSFVSSESSALIDSGKFQVKDGKGSFTLRVNYPDWGRYLVVAEDPNGHSAGKIVYIDWPGWAGRAQEGGAGSAQSVTLITDKKQYSVGENALVSFASSEGGRALVTIEKNGEILKQEWLETKKETTVYKLPLTAAMSPNVYVHITLLQPHQQTANSLPIRLFGVVPVLVDNPETKLYPVITTSEVYEPNTDVTVSISEKNGKAMTYTVAVVDEGLLGLTNYHAPELRSEFYKKEASQIKSYDLYRYVMNAYSGKLESLLLIGGSDGGVDNRDRKSNRFTPIVKFFGPYTLEEGQKRAITYNVGEYIGAVRTIVVAGENGAYGQAEKTSAVKADLMIQPSIPRTLGTKENIDIPLTVFNGTDQEQNYTVSLTSTGAVNKSEQKSVKVGANSNETVSFKVKTDTEGKAAFVFTAQSNGKIAESKTSVNVLSRGLIVTYRTPFEADSGKTKKVSVSSPLENAKLNLELSTFPAINLDERLSSLIAYPHGCIEQITSGAFPQLYLPTFLTLSDSQATSVKANIKSVIERYPNYQTALGGMGYWQGNSEANEWGSCYALHFLTEARRNGYLVSDKLYKPLAKYVEDKAAKWTPRDSDYTIQAYRVFDLALLGISNISAMNRLKEAIKEQDSPETKMLLAASYALSGRKKVAKDISESLKISFGKNNARITGNSFYSSYREKAIWLFVDTMLGGSRNALRVAKEIGETLSSDSWLNTQEIAWSLLALIPYYQSAESENAQYELNYNGKSEKDSFSSQAIIKNLVATNAKTQEISIKNTGKATLFGTLSATGRAVAGEEKAKEDGLKLSIEYTKEGEATSAKSLKLGDTFTITIDVENTTLSECENIALTLPLPTCWEINNDRIGLDSSEDSNYDYQDIKDTAVYTYFSLDAKKTKTFTFSATVAYSGSYYVPAVSAQAMYDNSYSALIPGEYAE